MNLIHLKVSNIAILRWGINFTILVIKVRIDELDKSILNCINFTILVIKNSSPFSKVGNAVGINFTILVIKYQASHKG